MKAKEKEFLQKLGELLKEYNASIVFTCADCSDRHGIYDEGMSVRMDGKEVARNSYWSIDATDLATRYKSSYKSINK